jgi:hypothetical protein
VSIIGLTLVYFDQRVRKEAFDLVMLLGPVDPAPGLAVEPVPEPAPTLMETEPVAVVAAPEAEPVVVAEAPFEPLVPIEPVAPVVPIEEDGRF